MPPSQKADERVRINFFIVRKICLFSYRHFDVKRKNVYFLIYIFDVKRKNVYY